MCSSPNDRAVPDPHPVDPAGPSLQGGPLSILAPPNDYLVSTSQSGVENQQTNPEKDSSRSHSVRNIQGAAKKINQSVLKAHTHSSY
jgi:hypothetical protein